MTLIIFGLLVISSSLMAQTTLTLQPSAVQGKDAAISSCIPCGFSTQNYGDYHSFLTLAWTNQGANSDIKSLLEFDLSSIPSTATIISAELSLYFNPDDIHGTHSTLTNSNESYLKRVTSSWNEYTVTWVNQPSVTQVNQVYLQESITPTQDYLDIDVSILVQDMVDNPTTSFGFMLEGVTAEEYYSLIFASSDHANSDLHPKLVITYLINDASVAELNEIEFQIYPNPTQESVAIESHYEVEKIEIINLFGEVVLVSFEPDQITDVSELSAGIYLVKIETSHGSSTEQLVIK